MPAQEQWLPVPGFPDYVASDLGQIASVKGGQFRILAGGKSQMGYRNVQLYQNGERAARRVHQLVALTFHGPRPEGLQIRHLDGDQLNNAAVNLAYGTAEENYWDKRLHQGRLLIVGPDRPPRLGRVRSSHCRHGHERTDANTYVSRKGVRLCRPCQTRVRAENRRRVALRAARVAGIEVAA